MDRIHLNPLAKGLRPSARAHLRKFEFNEVKWDGDVRLCFSVVPQIMEALNKEKVSFVFNKTTFPDPIDPIQAKEILRLEEEAQSNALILYQDELLTYPARLISWEDLLGEILNGARFVRAQRLAILRPKPEVPVLNIIPSRMTPSMSKSIPEFQKNILTLKNASDAAISIMRSFLGPNTLGYIDPALTNSKKSERENAFSLAVYQNHRNNI